MQTEQVYNSHRMEFKDNSMFTHLQVKDSFAYILLTRNTIDPKSKVNLLAQIHNLKVSYQVRRYASKSADKENYVCQLTVQNDIHMFESYGSVTVEKMKNGEVNGCHSRSSEQKAATNLIFHKFAEKDKSSYLAHQNGQNVESKLFKPRPSKATVRRQMKRLRKFIEKIDEGLIFYDLERSGGPLDTEIIQLAAVNGRGPNKPFGCYMVPSGSIDSRGSEESHKLRKWRGKLFNSSGVQVKSQSGVGGLIQFLEYLENIRKTARFPLVLVAHGNDHISLLNSLAYHGLLDRLHLSCQGFMDFQSIISMDLDIMQAGVRPSLSKVKPGSPNLFEYFFKRKVINSKAHDALYDSQLLQQVFWEYTRNGYIWEKMESFIFNHMMSVNTATQRASMTLRKTSKRRKNNKSGVKFFNALS